MFLAVAHSYLFLCLLLCTECLVSASEQVFNPDVWRVMLYNIIYNIKREGGGFQKFNGSTSLLLSLKSHDVFPKSISFAV